MQTVSPLAWIGRIFLLLALGLAAFCITAGLGPDRDLTLLRVFPSDNSPELLGKMLDSLHTWPAWHHDVEKVEVTDVTGEAASIKDQFLGLGVPLRFTLEPKQQSWRKYTIETKVIAYDPGHSVQLELVHDSTGKMEKLFKNYQWRIEILPPESGKTGARVQGQAFATTRSWRGRVLGALAEKILMYQSYYPDLLQLVKLTPEVLDPKIPLPSKEAADLVGPNKR